MRTRTIVAVTAVAALVVVGAAGGYVYVGHRHEAELDSQARALFTSYATAWTDGGLDAIAYSGAEPTAVAAGFHATTAALGDVHPTVSVTSMTRHGTSASAELAVSWPVTTGSTWSYSMPVAATDATGTWAIVTTPTASMWVPGIGPDATLVKTRTWGTRGEVLDRNGAPILANGTVYDVEIDPTRASDSTVSALETLVGSSPGSLVAKLDAAKTSGSKAPIPVIAYRESDFLARKTQLDSLIGVIYPKRTQPLAPTSAFARPLLGSYGPVTADIVQKSGGRYVAGDYAGLSGLQAQYDEVLAGTPGTSIATSFAPTTPLFEKPPVNGTSVTLTLDLAKQTAAENALAGSGSVPSALVAVDVKTGDLLAVANSPSYGIDRALSGTYPPGSTLKVATTYSLLSKGLSPTTTVTCPPSVAVGGLTISNYAGESFGAVPFSVDFAQSCNTAFVQLSEKMGNSDVHDAALALGIGAGWDKHLGLPDVATGSVPVATSTSERAATAFGQAKTLVSPADLAVMVGSVARGSYVEPALVSSPAVTGADRTPHPLDPAVIAQLHDLMRLVVTDGTGQVMKSTPGAPVYGKTGTAEYGTDTPPKTRAWFVGWQGDVAFCVLVEDGESGGAVAAPIAKAFLTALNG
jgi:cell division protein FtsI/penicillin-binding protein 2